MNTDTEHPILFRGAMVAAILDGRKTQTRRVVARANSIVDGKPCSQRLWDELDFASGKVFVDNGPSPAGNPGSYLHVPHKGDETTHRVYSRHAAGDWLWVKETHWRWGHWVRNGKTKTGKPAWKFRAARYPTAFPGDRPVRFLIDDPFGSPLVLPKKRTEAGWHTRPSIFMPRWASRLDMVVVKVRAERVRDISSADAIAEGIERVTMGIGDTGWKNYLFETAHSIGGLEITDEKNRVLAYVNPIRSFKSLWESIHGGTDFAWEQNPWVWVYEFQRVEKTTPPIRVHPCSSVFEK